MAKFEFDDDDSTQVSLALRARVERCEKYAPDSEYFAEELKLAKKAVERFNALMDWIDELEPQS